VRQRHVPGKPAYTSASTSRMTPWSGPPRAWIARATSGRDVHAEVSATSTALRTMLGVLLAALAGCARPAPAPVATVAPPEPAADVREATIDDGWITVRLQIPPTLAGRKPAVIGSVPDPDALLAAGAILVGYKINWELLSGLQPPGPPAPPAENTVGVWLLASPTAKTVGKAYFELIMHAAEHVIPRVVDHLRTLSDVDPDRIGVGGISTTGFTALGAVAADRRLAAATVVVACGEWRTFLHESSLAMNGKPLDLDPAYDRWLRAKDPVAHPARLVHAAVLMVNGTADTAIPVRCALDTARVFRRAYARAGVPERYRFVLVPGGPHTIGGGADVKYDVLAWWQRWLLSSRPG
jgi:Prolyl oligopeptidase family